VKPHSQLVAAEPKECHIVFGFLLASSKSCSAEFGETKGNESSSKKKQSRYNNSAAFELLLDALPT
jgi:hypothetical protein